MSSSLTNWASQIIENISHLILTFVSLDDQIVLRSLSPSLAGISKAAMEDSETAAPYTLLGFLIRGGDGDYSGFMRDYTERGKNALLWVGLFSITFLLLQKLARLVRLWGQGSRIPGPPSPSFFGHSKLIADRAVGQNMIGYLSKMHEKYGPIVRLWMGPTQMLISVKDIVMIEEMLVKAEDKLPLIGRAFRLAFGRSTLFVSSFDKARRTRESLAVYMNKNVLERLNQVPGKVVEHVLERFVSIVAKDVPDRRQVSEHMASYILGASMFGDAFLNWTNASLYEELLVTVAKEACFWDSYRIPPFWSRRYRRYHFLCTRLKELNKDIIDESMKSRNVAGKEDGTTVFIDAMMFGGSLFHGKTKKHHFSEEEQCDNILGLIFHGFLTTASLINSILTRLALHPELQENIYWEIISLKKTSKFDLSDVQKMNFLLATIYESARLLPPGPLLQRCSLNHDLKLKSGITVPAGAIIVVPLPLVHMDYSVWGKDADQFYPQHFIPMTCSHKDGTLDEHEASKEITSELQIDGSFLSFGSGARSCVGQKFVILALSALFASLLDSYEIRLHPGSDNDPKARLDGCCLRPHPSPNIFFIKRNKT
ncbi:hypothetical protein IEQ34_002001 [Dendrobium chrysotoxum]|uniref:Cytochrome P450 n=1 Tax=Dendrobium chrysotoxum TaxID=161865 RepID=A0AAV7HM14_DENCH|nr:hypothetical protein IEQ34_002001 [Dendrobium chrysotoxum]